MKKELISSNFNKFKMLDNKIYLEYLLSYQNIKKKTI